MRTAARSPVQILVIAAAVAIGLLLGMWAIGQRAAVGAGDRERSSWPDLEFEHAAPADLVRLGFRLTGREPQTWSDIANRQFQDARGFVNLVRCRIAPEEAAALIQLPRGSRRPQCDAPPADWPWGEEGERMRVPAWWRPEGGQSRMFEELSTSGSRGIFANYDPGSRVLHFWTWSRSDWRPVRTSPLAYLVTDELVTAIERSVRAAGQPADAQGWLHVVGLEPSACGLPAGRMPVEVTRIDAVLLPISERHRYLLAVHGVDDATASRLVGELPLRALSDDAPPPVSAWRFAGMDVATTSSPARLPTWFAPGPGWRRCHCLLEIGPGRVESGRWVAYAAADRTLYVWDWQGPGFQPAEADLIVGSR